MITAIQLFALGWIFAFAVTMKITQIIRDHVAAKDALKLFEMQKDASDAARRAAEWQEISAKIEQSTAQTKILLADKIASLNEEQLAAYNRTLQQPVKQYVPVPMLPIIPQYPPAFFYDTQQANISQMIQAGVSWRWP